MMSLRVSKYSCICGGEITELRQNGAESRRCDKCNSPKSKRQEKLKVLRKYEEYYCIELRNLKNECVLNSVYVNTRHASQESILDLINESIEDEGSLSFYKVNNGIAWFNLSNANTNKVVTVCIYINGQVISEEEYKILIA